MPQFPRSKNEILVLAAKIAYGITNHPADYPNPRFEPTSLNNFLLLPRYRTVRVV